MKRLFDERAPETLSCTCRAQRQRASGYIRVRPVPHVPAGVLRQFYSRRLSNDNNCVALFVCTRSVRRVCRHCMGSEFTRSSAPVVSSAQVVLPVVFYCWVVLPLLATELGCVLLFPLALVLRHHREEIADGRQKR